MRGINRIGKADLRNKDTGDLYEIISKVFRKGQLRWVCVNLTTGREILLAIHKMETQFDKL